MSADVDAKSVNVTGLLDNGTGSAMDGLVAGLGMELSSIERVASTVGAILIIVALKVSEPTLGMGGSEGRLLLPSSARSSS